MQTVRIAHDQMLDEKRSEILETVRQCMEATHIAADGDPKAMDIIIKGADLTLEEGLDIAHGILLIKEVVLFLEQIVDQLDVVLLLVQHFLRCSNSVVHYCLIRVLVGIIVLLVQFVIMLQLVSELIGNKFNQTIFVRRHYHPAGQRQIT